MEEKNTRTDNLMCALITEMHVGRMLGEVWRMLGRGQFPITNPTHVTDKSHEEDTQRT